MFTLTIETGNAAFGDDPTSEVAAILTKLARQISYQDQTDTVRDTNGNTVGRWTFER